MIRRCPFLNTAPSVYQRLSAEPALVSYAHKCPVLMELASTALPCSAAVTRGSPANGGQLQTCGFSSTAFILYARYRIFVVLLDPMHKITESPNEATPPAGSTVASRCPFLTAEKNRVVREASVELQEDIQEMDSRCKGEQPRTRLLKMTTKLQSL